MAKHPELRAALLLAFCVCCCLASPPPAIAQQTLPEPTTPQPTQTEATPATPPASAPEWTLTPLQRGFLSPDFQPQAPIGTVEPPRILRLGPPDQFETEPNFRLRTFITVSEEFTDNALQTKNDRKSDFRTNIAPGIAVNLERPNLSLGLVYVPRFYFPANQDIDSNEVNQDVSLRAAWRPTARLQFGLTEDFTQSNDFRDIQDPGSQYRGTGGYLTNQASATAAYIAPQFRASLSYRNTLNQNNDNSINDNMTNAGTASMEVVSARTTYSGAYTLSRGEFKNASSASYWEHNGTLGVVHSLSPTISLTGNGLVTYQEKDGANLTNFVIGQVRIGGTMALTPAGSRIVAQIGGQVYAPDPGETEFSPSGLISWTQQFGFGSLTAGYEHSLRNDFTSVTPTGVSELREASLLLSTSYFRDLTFTLGGRWYWQEYKNASPSVGPAGTTENTWEAQAWIRYLIIRSLTVALGYTLTNRTSDRSGNEYLENRIQLSLSYNYDRW